MGTKEDVSQTYDFADEVVRLALGEHPDLSCGMYNGDYSKSLEQAQRDKHDFVVDAIRCAPGTRVLDIGCGYGPMLKAVSERGGHAIGLTLSPKHAEACKRAGFEAYVMDWKDLTPSTFGTFDAIVCLDVISHFCSIEEYQAGKQDQIYDNFFRLCCELLPPGGRFYFQAFMFGKNAPPVDQMSTRAPRGSNEYIMGIVREFYPGSCSPFGEDHILRVADPYFRLLWKSNGRLDYIETMNQWDRTWKFDASSLRDPVRVARRLWAISRLVPLFLTDNDFRRRTEYIRKGYDTETWKRELLDHTRMLFERK